MHTLPPIAPKRPHIMTHHGHTRTDDYYWMNDREDEEVIRYITQENEYLEQELSDVKELREELYEEMISRIAQNESSAPNQIDDWIYWSTFSEGQEYPVYLRKKVDSEEEEIILDVNILAEGKPYCAVMGSKISPDHNILAYAVDFQGRRICDIYFKDLRTGKLIGDPIRQVTGNLTWAMDNVTVFYTRMDIQTLRPNQIFRHQLGSDKEDQLVYEETDDTFRCSVGRTTSKKFLMIHSGSTLTDEVRILEADQPEGAFRVFRVRERGHEYRIDHLDGTFYIHTNEDAVNFKIAVCPEGNYEASNWKSYLNHREDTLIEGFDLFDQFFIVEERRGGQTHIRILSRTDNKRDEYLSFDDPAYTASIAYNPDPSRRVLRYHYESLTTPASIFEVHLETGETTTIWQKEVVGEFSSDWYRSERIMVTARDGVEVPVSIVYHKDTPLDGSAPLLQYGYGSYGLSIDPYFSIARLSLMNRGMIYAIAHIRGGSEMGRKWYENGRQLQKMNTFTDFIDCGEALLEKGYTSKGKLYCMGGSAGGLLVGAVMNLRPDLYHAVVAAVPFVDVVTTMLDDSIPLTTGEYDEWGNPNEETFFRYMLSYSPYDNVKTQEYPNVLITSGLHDSQVQYFEPTKWIARLREHQRGKGKLLMYTNMDAGHGGASGRFEAFRETALIYAFLLGQE